MRSKRIIMALIVAIMMISAVACGTANKAEESKTTDETTKEVSSTVAPTEATTTATEATKKKKEEETDSHGHTLINSTNFIFDDNLKLSEETCKNISDYFKDKVFTKGDIINLSEIQYAPDEYNSMEYLGFLMIEIYPHDGTSSNFRAPFEVGVIPKTEILIEYDEKHIKIMQYIIS